MLRKRIPAVVLLSLYAAFSALAQESWTWTVAPQLRLDAGPGVRFGVQGTAVSPDEGNRFTLNTRFSDKGAGGFSLAWDARLPLAGIQVHSGIAALDDPFAPFYGFNGAAEPRRLDADPARNAIHKNMLRARLDVSGNIVRGLRWDIGFTCHYAATERISDRFSYGDATLYDHYLGYGIFNPLEQVYGEHIALRAGLSYHAKAWSAAVSADTSPDYFLDGNAYTRLGLIFRGSMPLQKERIRLGLRAGAQHTLSGQTPWYLLSDVLCLPGCTPMQEGLEEAVLMRCVLPERLLAKGFVWFNLDLPCTLNRFRKSERDWTLEADPFLDFTLLTQSYRIAQQAGTSLDRIPYEKQLRKRSRFPHESAGMVLNLHSSDRSFSFLLGAPFHKEDGLFSMGLSACFRFK